MTPHALAQLHALAYDAPWSAESFASALDQPGAVLIASPVCFALGRVILDEAELFHIATDPRHRRHGHGQNALSAFEARAAALGARRAFLEVAADSSAAQALYRTAGWQVDGVRRGYYRRPGHRAVDAIAMSKRL